ncbi:hypothetical protein FRB91_011359 [Serendipita sp. 411]|nr:hypothetical protein FRB91_011359 [Serendipita sp. 411]
MQKLGNIARSVFTVLRASYTPNHARPLHNSPLLSTKTMYEPISLLEGSPWANDRAKYNRFRSDLRSAIEAIVQNNPRGLQYRAVDQTMFQALVPKYPELETWDGLKTFHGCLRDCLTTKHHTALKDHKAGKTSSSKAEKANQLFEYTVFDESVSQTRTQNPARVGQNPKKGTIPY